MAMNSGQDGSPDHPNAEGSDADPDTDADPDADAEGPDADADADIDTESLRRSRDAIDQAREAVREALEDDADVAEEVDS